MADSKQRGLLVPAWTDGRSYNGAKVVFVAESRFAGKTVAQVARKLKISPERVKNCALMGKCPSTLEVRKKNAYFWVLPT